jgi:hypothetical protein
MKQQILKNFLFRLQFNSSTGYTRHSHTQLRRTQLYPHLVVGGEPRVGPNPNVPHALVGEPRWATPKHFFDANPDQIFYFLEASTVPVRILQFLTSLSLRFQICQSWRRKNLRKRSGEFHFQVSSQQKYSL